MSFRALIALVAALGAAAPAAAEQWVPVAKSQDGSQSYYVDAESVSTTGGFVHSWTRADIPRGQKIPANGKTYVTSLSERYDDCAGRRFRFDLALMRDAKGKTVASTQFPPASWTAVVPGSISESMAKTVCRIAAPPKEDPWVKDISSSGWTQLGTSQDRSFTTAVLMDQVMKVSDGMVMVLARSEYEQYRIMDNVPVKVVIEAYLLDCKGARLVNAGGDYYITPQIRAFATRVDKDREPQFSPIQPGSFLANSLRQICAAGVEAASADDEEGEVGSGTAWGVNKGYLVTASHVITDAKTIAVYQDGQEIGEARVVADDPVNDLAVLKLVKAPPGKLNILLISPRGASLGRSIFTLGYPEPGVLGQRIKMTAGEVSATAGIQDDARHLQISAPIQPGNSGGPLIGWDGSVLGVVSSKLTRFGDEPSAAKPENVNYAVKAAYLRPMLEDLPDLANYVVVRTTPTTKPDDLIAAARKAVFMLIVEK